jgi:hypothetical protein
MARMSWKRFASTISAAVILGAGAPAVAADEEFGRSGPFVGAGAAVSFENFGGSAGNNSPDEAWGYQLKAGYRFNEYFALEADGEHFPSFNSSTGDVEIWDATLNGKLYPLHGFIQPYLSAGAGWSGINDDRAASNEDSQGFAARFAGGVDVYFHRNFGAFAEVAYFLPTGARADYDMIPLSFGIFYRFF